jgi:membrane protease YdiL (CAAX protease family)
MLSPASLVQLAVLLLLATALPARADEPVDAGIDIVAAPTVGTATEIVDPSILDGGYHPSPTLKPGLASLLSSDSDKPVPQRALPNVRPEAPGFKRARLSADEPPSQQELDDRYGFQHPQCNPRWGAVYPGLGALCAGRDTEGKILFGVATAELATGLTVGALSGFGSTAAELPLLGFGDLFTGVTIEASLRVQRSLHLPYVPQETLADDFAAPFRPEVLKQPDVYLGIIGLVAAGYLFEQYVDGPLSTETRGQRPVLFGKTLNPSVGYPLATAIGVGLFSQVATAEEVAFRGMVQSGLTRSYGEIPGWIGGSLIFGLFHASNVIFLPSNQRVDYLTHGVPFITIVGSYLGFTYMNHNYSLSSSIAVHFWYDLLIEGISFILDPKNSPLAFSYAF